MKTKDVMTPAERERVAKIYEDGAAIAKRESEAASHAAKTNPESPDHPVVSRIFENIAREWDNLAVYYAGKAAGFRQE